MSGCSSRTLRPDAVRSDGLECTVPPYTSMRCLRYGLDSYEARTCHTSRSMPNLAHANDRALPHWPAPVSVVSFFTPSTEL